MIICVYQLQVGPPSVNHGLLFMPKLWLCVLCCFTIEYATSAAKAKFQQYRNWGKHDVADFQTCSAANGVNKPTTLRCVAQ